MMFNHNSTTRSAPRLIRDVSRVSSLTVFSIGILAGLATLIAVSVLNQINLFQPRFASLAGNWWMGAGAFLIASGFAAFGYSFIFKSAHRSGALVGLNLALFHWLIAGLLAAPLSRGGLFFFAEGFSAATIFFVLHLFYGAIVGELFDRAAIRGDYAKPLNAA